MMKGNTKIYFSFFPTNIQIGIEVVIKVKNLTKTISLVEHWHRKISHVFGIQNYCRFLSLFNIQNMYVFAAKRLTGNPMAHAGFYDFSWRSKSIQMRFIIWNKLHTSIQSNQKSSSIVYRFIYNTQQILNL